MSFINLDQNLTNNSISAGIQALPIECAHRKLHCLLEARRQGRLIRPVLKSPGKY